MESISQHVPIGQWEASDCWVIGRDFTYHKSGLDNAATQSNWIGVSGRGVSFSIIPVQPNGYASGYFRLPTYRRLDDCRNRLYCLINTHRFHSSNWGKPGIALSNEHWSGWIVLAKQVTYRLKQRSQAANEKTKHSYSHGWPIKRNSVPWRPSQLASCAKFEKISI